MAPITVCETALLEHSTRVKYAERGWQTKVAARDDRCLVAPAVAERRERRPSPLGVFLTKVLNGGVIAAIAAWTGRCYQLSRTSWDGPGSKEHELAAHGMKWVTDLAEDERLADELKRASQRRAAPVERQPLVVLPKADDRVIGAARVEDRYPVLAVIDRVRDDGGPAFADDPNAAHLELRARVLTEQFWSEMAWITGIIPERAFWFVCQALERERTDAARFGSAPTDVGTAA